MLFVVSIFDVIAHNVKYIALSTLVGRTTGLFNQKKVKKNF